ncbi:MAG: sigma-70 family RNA polymerase sigma factor [Thermoleophilia bacterium]
MATLAPRPQGSSYASLSDAALTTLVQDGDQRAFEVVFTRFKDVLLKYAWTVTGNREDAEEAVQTAMVNAYRALQKGGDTPIALRPWLFRITHNAAISVIRSRQEGVELPDEIEVPSGAIPGPYERVERRERISTLLQDIARLPERQRAALMMREVGGLSHRHVAGAMKTSAEDVRRLVHDARVSLVENEAGREDACSAVRSRIANGDRRVMRGRRVAAHLRECPGCALFATADAERRRRLAGWIPVYPAAAAWLSELLPTASSGSAILAGGGFNPLGRIREAGLGGAAAAAAAAVGLALAGIAVVGSGV